MRGCVYFKYMNTIMIVGILVVFVIAAVILIVLIYNIISGREERQASYQNQSKSVLVKNGVNVKKQVIGGEKGEYFTGNLEQGGTYYVNSAVTIWRAVFDNLNTKERSYMDFTRQMWIGRTGASQNEPVKLTLPDDSKISRSHCSIYERDGVLYIQDLKSSNHTYLNGKIITGAVCLQNGDVIQAGNTKLRVQYSIINDRPA